MYGCVFMYLIYIYIYIYVNWYESTQKQCNINVWRFEMREIMCNIYNLGGHEITFLVFTRNTSCPLCNTSGVLRYLFTGIMVNVVLNAVVHILQYYI